MKNRMSRKRREGEGAERFLDCLEVVFGWVAWVLAVAWVAACVTGAYAWLWSQAHAGSPEIVPAASPADLGLVFVKVAGVVAVVLGAMAVFSSKK